MIPFEKNQKHFTENSIHLDRLRVCVSYLTILFRRKGQILIKKFFGIIKSNTSTGNFGVTVKWSEHDMVINKISME